MRTGTIRMVNLVVSLLAMSTLASAQGTPTVETDGTTATAIRNLELNGIIYDVEFVNRSSLYIYGNPPEFDFSSAQEASTAVATVNGVLNTQGNFPTVGPSREQGLETYKVGFNVITVIVQLTEVFEGRALVPSEPGSWSTAEDRNQFPFLDAGNFADFTEVSGSECSDNAGCNDGEFCTGVEICDGGQCQDGTGPCGEGFICQEESDDCVEITCINDDQCDDGRFCNGDETCNAAGQCLADTSPCEAGEVCLEDSDDCFLPECTTNDDCDNGVFCDGDETCDAGQCLDGTPRSCGDGDACTDDECNLDLDECVSTPDVTPCDDGDLCTVDTCDSETGCTNVPVECSAGQLCDPVDGTCKADTECTIDDDCGDGFFCNGDETCDAGQCQQGTPPCVGDEICIDIIDSCADPECALDDDCDDGSFCSGEETCDAGRCQDGTWACGVSEICVDIIDECVEAECILDDQCDDGRFCNGGEMCNAGQCRIGGTSPCGAGETCLEESDECVEDDNLPPDCSLAVPSIHTIWPPNNKFVPVNVHGVLDPDDDPVSLKIDSIFQDERVSVRRSPADGYGVGSDTAHLRAKRAGSGNGRVYHISFTADDGQGGSCTGEVVVGVPHDRGKGSVAVDDGPIFDSTSGQASVAADDGSILDSTSGQGPALDSFGGGSALSPSVVMLLAGLCLVRNRRRYSL
jgi:hypothetical protein